MFFGRNSPISSGPLFSSVNTTFGQTPIVYERRCFFIQLLEYAILSVLCLSVTKNPDPLLF